MPDGARDPEPRLAGQDLEDVFQRLFRDGRVNAITTWVLVAVLALVFVESLLDVDIPWVVFVAVAGAIILLPPLAYRDWRVMLPWELLLLALFPILVRGLVGGTLGTFATYLSIAAFALLVTVELHLFTELEVTHWFAVVFVVLATLATVAVWTIFRWHADRVLATTYLADNYTLMVEWFSVTLAGFAAGVLFDGYFRRRDRQLWRALRWMVRR